MQTSYVEPLVNCFRDVPAATKQTKVRVALANNTMTPSRGLIAASVRYTHEHQVSLDVFVNANPDTSVFNDSEIKLMEDDLFQCQELGADGVVIGATTADHQIDSEAMETLIGASDGMEMFFSPAFDNIAKADWDKNIAWLVDHDFSGIITSKNLTELNERLVKEASLRLIPLTNGNDELVKVEENLKPFIVINHK
ncbi:copper homeostasis protein CutC [Fructilactobacillus sp. Tb1]|uniref:copper homeostasis protein CutC n=1 Tax=Fructilactobacillus sp. Tb1 TaxID=3422304 RepID=UPI003D2E3161